MAGTSLLPVLTGTILLLVVVAISIVWRVRRGYQPDASPEDEQEQQDGGADHQRLDRIRCQTDMLDDLPPLVEASLPGTAPAPAGPDEGAALDEPAAGEGEREPAFSGFPPDTTVSETLSVVLRRQIPPRLDEAPRSWLGGLPMLPDVVEWPRGRDPERPAEEARPLHFVAQIACADLPAALWGGLGPRTGWLLFFFNGNTCLADHPDASRVIHIAELGPERLPPADICPVHDGIGTGSRFAGWMAQADVPPIWRRWPVDIVSVPNQLVVAHGRSLATPAGFAEMLYDDAPVADDTVRPPLVEPFSWRCVGYGWQGLADALSVLPGTLQNTPLFLERLAEQGGVATLLEQFDQRPDAADRPRLRARVARLVEEHPAIADLEGVFAQEQARLGDWWREAPARMAELDAHIRRTEPDSPLDPEHWHDIRAYLDADRCTVWQLGWGPDRVVTIARRAVTLWDWFHPRAYAAAPEVAGEYYVDPDRRHLLPPALVEAMEPWWRALVDNRPHRMGGYHDGVQSDAVEGPTSVLLLLQLATDIGMQWGWGDSGAVYWSLRTGELTEGAFDKAECWLESH